MAGSPRTDSGLRCRDVKLPNLAYVGLCHVVRVKQTVLRPRCWSNLHPVHPNGDVEAKQARSALVVNEYGSESSSTFIKLSKPSAI